MTNPTDPEQAIRDEAKEVAATAMWHGTVEGATNLVAKFGIDCYAKGRTELAEENVQLEMSRRALFCAIEKYLCKCLDMDPDETIPWHDGKCKFIEFLAQAAMDEPSQPADEESNAP